MTQGDDSPTEQALGQVSLNENTVPSQIDLRMKQIEAKLEHMGGVNNNWTPATAVDPRHYFG